MIMLQSLSISFNSGSIYSGSILNIFQFWLNILRLSAFWMQSVRECWACSSCFWPLFIHMWHFLCRFSGRWFFQQWSNSQTDTSSFLATGSPAFKCFLICASWYVCQSCVKGRCRSRCSSLSQFVFVISQVYCHLRSNSLFSWQMQKQMIVSTCAVSDSYARLSWQGRE